VLAVIERYAPSHMILAASHDMAVLAMAQSHLVLS
jgi:hypothetical protein